MKNQNTSNITSMPEVKVVRLLKNSAELNELINLAANPGLDMESKEVKNTAFYKSIQDATHLDASYLGQPWYVSDLVAQIAATSSSLLAVSMNGNTLDDDGYFPLSISKSKSITSLDLSFCKLGSTAAVLYNEIFAEKMTKLNSLNMSGNKINAKSIIKSTEFLMNLHNFTSFNISQNLRDEDKQDVRDKLESLSNTRTFERNKSLFDGAFGFLHHEDQGLHLYQDVACLIAGHTEEPIDFII